MRTVFFDVDTQNDFVLPAGALYAPGAEKILPQVARLNRWAADNGIALISTADAHAENDPEFANWPPHCVAGTIGQRKPEQTLVGQTVLTKQALDCFTIAELPGLLESLKAERYVVYGVVTEICVRFAAFGLLKTGRRVEVVADAVQSLNESAAAKTLEEFTAAGGFVTRTAAIAL